MKTGNIHYIEQGLRDGLPVVLIHAFPLNHTMWNPQISATRNYMSFRTRGI